jgi:hypothetical protein
MESRISARPDVSVATTTPRVTPTPPRTQFKEVLTRSLVRGAETAMRVLPGSPLMAVAVRGAGGPAPSLGVPMTGTGGMATRSANLASPEGPGGGGAAGTSLSASGGAGGAGGAGGESGLESSLAQSQEMNLYYLQVQEAVNAQNRSFTALSNVLKAEHDTVKTAIGNIR